MELKEGMRWDYEAGWYFLDEKDINGFLNSRAKQGWELMAIQDRKNRVFCVFRRQVFSERYLELQRRKAEKYRVGEICDPEAGRQ